MNAAQSRLWPFGAILLVFLGLYLFSTGFFLAKRSLPQRSTCQDAPQLFALLDVPPQPTPCWSERRVDTAIFLIVDALRFDFAQRLPTSLQHTGTLVQFLADPPTVTMQRLKALTTGGLPTFADISGNMGGASVQEDTWVSHVRLGFVGDDTWTDLFDNFVYAYPYPSFNTRDLDTVDNGCMDKLPFLMSKREELDVVVVHFLGVDHVGHTYGPEHPAMDRKLQQMDEVLSHVLDEAAEGCQVTYIMGDHGMTPDGNHGGGTVEETHAALFAHFSEGCPESTTKLDAKMATSQLVPGTFQAVQQIDIVATLAVSLGIPIPYSNLGSIIPSLWPETDLSKIGNALALNAAQVWRYLSVYSETANPLDGLNVLEGSLHMATAVHRQAISAAEDDDLWGQTAALYKAFLQDALELGQRVWTRFDMQSMITGIVIMGLGVVCNMVPLVKAWWTSRNEWVAETATAGLFLVYHTVLLTFSNSYIYEEQGTLMYAIAIMSFVLTFRLWSRQHRTWIVLICIPLLCRAHELFVSGHGMDPSIGVHSAHHPFLFGAAMVLLIVLRMRLYFMHVMQSWFHAGIDCAIMALILCGWWEKRIEDTSRNGFLVSGIALIALAASTVLVVFQTLIRSKNAVNSSDQLICLNKLCIGIMAVTGPSTAPSMVLYILASIFLLEVTTNTFAPTLCVAALWKFIVRHAFFSTNHGCTFSRLQLSAAFVATNEFNFALGGISLFTNTFGWEMIGLLGARLLSQLYKRDLIWRIYSTSTLIEALFSCISVTLLRRHLMVWDIYAPRFLFSAIFGILTLMSQSTVTMLNFHALASKKHVP